jgi:hypothetical protein
LVQAAVANRFPRDEMPLADVLRMRLTTDLDWSGLHLTAKFVRDMIEEELSDAAIKARWHEALDAAGSSVMGMTVDSTRGFMSG